MTLGFRQGRNPVERCLFGSCQHKGSVKALSLQKVIKGLNVYREVKGTAESWGFPLQRV